MAVSGAFEEMKALARAFGTIDQALKVAAANAAPKIYALIQDQFAKGQDPFGNAWANLKNGDRSFLVDTGALRASLTVTPEPLAIRIKFDAPYAVVHQGGRSNMPARPLVPKSQELPPAWVAVLEQSLDEALKAHFKRFAA